MMSPTKQDTSLNGETYMTGAVSERARQPALLQASTPAVPVATPAPYGAASLNEGPNYAKLDGVTHINIYSKGQTSLGAALSHFAYSPFVHPHYGPFNSMEGFWYWIKACDHVQHDTLRSLVGFKAKEYGREIPTQKIEQFQELIVDANFHKIDQNPQLKELMVESVLPFDHYYLFGPKAHFVRQPNFEWLVHGFERIREALKHAHKHRLPAVWPSPNYNLPTPS